MTRDRFALGISAAYFGVALAWILFSDRIAALVTTDPDRATLVQNVKGGGFVLLSALLLYFFTRRKIRQFEAARQAMAESAEYNRVLMEEAPDGLLVVNSDGSIRAANKSFVALSGYTAEELSGKHVGELFLPEDVAEQPMLYPELVRLAGQALQSERRLRRKDGSLVRTDWHSKLLPNGLIQSMARDITHRVEAETAVQRHADRLQVLAEATKVFAEATDNPARLAETIVHLLADVIGDNCGIWLASPTGERIEPVAGHDVDPQFDSLIRLNVAELYFMPGEGAVGKVFETGDSLLVREVPADRQLRRSVERWQPIFEKMAIRSMIYVPVRARGTSLGVLSLARHRPDRPLYDDDDLRLAQELADRAALAISNAQLIETAQRELAERVEAERALRESEIRFRTLADTAPVLIWLSDGEGHVSFVNATWLVFTGRTLDEEVGSGWLKGVHGDDYERARATMRDALVRRERLTVEFRLRRADGEYRWLLNTGTPRYAPDGAFAGYIGSCVDLTERRQAEADLKALNDDLEQRVAERTAELTAANARLLELDQLRSKFVAHVTHELRTPVTSLAMRVYMMTRTPERFAEHAQLLTEQTDRLKHLIDSVLDLSRIDLSHANVTFEPVDLNALVEVEANALAGHADDVGLELIYRPAAESLSVSGAPGQLAQIVSNLVGNAIHYTPSGWVEISTWLDETRGLACVRVRDTGLGIAPEDLPHLFERFFRGRTVTEEDIPGSGLGLSIVKEIVDLHHGSIEVESVVGAGSTFSVWLPVEPHAAPAAR